MKIWHFGASVSPQKVCGVTRTVWLIARQQATFGHQVALVFNSQPDRAAIEDAEQAGIELIYLPSKKWRYETKYLDEQLQNWQPHIVHMHSVFIPNQATLARALKQRSIPYIVTPHGGLDFRRSRVQKIIYSTLIEKSRFRQASAITGLTDKEIELVRKFVPNYNRSIHSIFNPIDSSQFGEMTWHQNIASPKIVYLGRFDVVHKGLDILGEIARYLPEAEFHLYGQAEAKSQAELARLKLTLSGNVYFHPPVFDREKAEVLANASLYIQASRWEGFGISIAEAMYLGIPCAISDTLDMAVTFKNNDLGFVFSPNPPQIAKQLRDLLQNPDRLRYWSDRARRFARENYQLEAVTLNYLHVYEEAIESHSIQAKSDRSANRIRDSIAVPKLKSSS
jgi:glycosyltransferase involved in cell wall biosynthesis